MFVKTDEFGNIVYLFSGAMDVEAAEMGNDPDFLQINGVTISDFEYPHECYKLVDGKIVLRDDYEAVLEELNLKALEPLKRNKLFEINRNFEGAMQRLAEEYPEREILSWSQQEREARAYAADPTSPTPLVDALCAARDIPKDELVQKILQKAGVYAQAAGVLIGKRQALEDQVKAATTVEELDAIQW